MPPILHSSAGAPLFVISRGWWPPVLWGLLILILTSIPGSVLEPAMRIAGLDKAVHAALYAMLAWFVARAFPFRLSSGRRLLAFAGIGLFALLDEWHQRWVPGRAADMADWLADVAGAGLALGLSRLALTRREAGT